MQKILDQRLDCHDMRRPGEPHFTLLGRDPLAGHLVSIWAKMRMGDIVAASAVFLDMLEKNALRYTVEPDTDRGPAAMQICIEMFKYRASGEVSDGEKS